MIPAPPERPAVVFNPPPGWSAPAAFDPRRGHLVDPSWPAAPQGWAFWVADPSAGPERATLPSVALPRAPGEGRRERRRLVVILGVVAVVVVGGGVWAAVAPEPVPAVGTCWSGSGEWVNEVPCGSAEAEFAAVLRTTSPEACPASSDSYLEFGDAILCLETR